MIGNTIAILAQVNETETENLKCSVSCGVCFRSPVSLSQHVLEKSYPKTASSSVWDAAMADADVPYEAGTVQRDSAEAEFPLLVG